MAGLAGHVQAVEHEVHLQFVAHRPSHTPAEAEAELGRQGEKALARGQVGDVADPDAISRDPRRGRTAVSPDSGQWPDMPGIRGPHAPRRRGTGDQPLRASQPDDAFPPRCHTLRLQLALNARGAIRG